MARAPLLRCTFAGLAQNEVGIKNTFLAWRFDEFDIAATAVKRCSSVPASFKPCRRCADAPRSSERLQLCTPPAQKEDGERQLASRVERAPTNLDTCAAGRRKARPTKNQRELYRKVVANWEDAYLKDPVRFDFDSVTVPAIVSEEPSVRAFLLDRVLGRLRRLQEELAVPLRTPVPPTLATCGPSRSFRQGPQPR